MLLLGLINPSLAHTCIPDDSGNLATVSTQTGTADGPCHLHEDMQAPPSGDSPCCQIEVDNCLHSAEAGMLIQSYPRIGDQQPEAVTTATVPYPLLIAVSVASSYTHAPSATLPDQHNTYLVTRRLRI